MLIIPAIDLLDGCCVRLQQGDPQRRKVYSSDPISMAQRWQAEGARRLHLVNLNGAFGDGQKNFQIIEGICRALAIPVQLGGGIRTVADAEKWLHVGIDRVIIGTVAVAEPQILEQMVQRCGRDRIIVALDARQGKLAVRGWQEASDDELLDTALRLQHMGIERIIFTDIHTDGLQQGPNYAAIRLLLEKTDLKVIVSGGMAEKVHFEQLLALQQNGMEGVIVGTALYEGRLQLSELVGLYQTEAE